MKPHAGQRIYDQVRSGSSAGTVVPIRFAVWCLSLFAIVSLLPERLFSPLNRHTAKATAEILRIFGVDSVLAGTVLTNGSLAVDVITECSAIYVWILFISFVASSASQPRRKIAGLFMWLPLLHVANIIRIALIFTVGVKVPILFDLAHVYLGQVLMVILLLAACMAWFRSSGSGPVQRVVPEYALQCIVWSAIPFLAWVLYNRDYVIITDQFVRWIFTLFGRTLEIPYTHTLYFQTFNLVTISGILLAGRERFEKRRVPMILSAFTAVVTLHLLIRTCNVLITAFGISAAMAVSTAATVVGQYLIPVLCWMFLVRAGSMDRENRCRNSVVAPD